MTAPENQDQAYGILSSYISNLDEGAVTWPSAKTAQIAAFKMIVDELEAIKFALANIAAKEPVQCVHPVEYRDFPQVSEEESDFTKLLSKYLEGGHVVKLTSEEPKDE